MALGRHGIKRQRRQSNGEQRKWSIRLMHRQWRSLLHRRSHGRIDTDTKLIRNKNTILCSIMITALLCRVYFPPVVVSTIFRPNFEPLRRRSRPLKTYGGSLRFCPFLWRRHHQACGTNACVLEDIGCVYHLICHMTTQVSLLRPPVESLLIVLTMLAPLAGSAVLKLLALLAFLSVLASLLFSLVLLL